VLFNRQRGGAGAALGGGPAETRHPIAVHQRKYGMFQRNIRGRTVGIGRAGRPQQAIGARGPGSDRRVVARDGCCGDHGLTLRLLLRGKDQQAHYLPTLSVPICLHMIGGAPPLALMPLQFIGRLRARWPRAHRISGRVCCLAVLAGGIGAPALLPLFRGGPLAATGFAPLALFWLACTPRAFWLARAHCFGRHRAWILRSAGVTFGPSPCG